MPPASDQPYLNVSVYRLTIDFASEKPTNDRGRGAVVLYPLAFNL
jgi:hypothetical protein